MLVAIEHYQSYILLTEINNSHRVLRVRCGSASFWNGENDPCPTTQSDNMGGRLVIAFAAEQKAENAGRKLLSMQKQGQTDIEDAVAALKRQTARSN